MKSFFLLLVLTSLYTTANAAINVTNIQTDTIIHYPVTLLIGNGAAGPSLRVINHTPRADSRPTTVTVVDGRFKALVELISGINIIELKSGSDTQTLNLTYHPDENDHLVRVIYMTGSDKDTGYQTPDKPGKDYAARLDTAVKLMQTFTAERMNDAGYGRKTFALELDKRGKVVVHALAYPMKAQEMRDYTLTDYWKLYYDWLDKQFSYDNNKCLVVMAFTRFDPDQKKVYGHTALGGGGEGVFGSAGMFSWPKNIHDVERAFSDAAPVDGAKVHDDSAFRSTNWGLAATTIGAMLHEMGHTFGLPHVADPESIMSRGFDHFNRLFTVIEPAVRDGKNPTQFTNNQIAHWDDASAKILSECPWFR